MAFLNFCAGLLIFLFYWIAGKAALAGGAMMVVVADGPSGEPWFVPVGLLLCLLGAFWLYRALRLIVRGIVRLCRGAASMA